MPVSRSQLCTSALHLVAYIAFAPTSTPFSSTYLACLLPLRILLTAFAMVIETRPISDLIRFFIAIPGVSGIKEAASS